MAWHDRDYNRTDYGGQMVGGPGRTAFGRWSGMSVSMWLIVINIAVFVLDGVLERHVGPIRADGYPMGPLEFAGFFSMSKAIMGFQIWRFISFQFLHAGLGHILGNMFGLYFFGPLVESYLGPRRFLAFYLLCGVVGPVCYTIFAVVGILGLEPSVPMVGASAGVFGILIAGARVAPHQRVMLLFPPIPMSLRTLAYVYVGIAAYIVLTAGGNAGGQAAHLGGAAMGFFLVRQPHLLDFAGRLRLGGGLQMGKRWQQRKAGQRRAHQAGEDANVDRILDKVRQKGLHSLSAGEQRTLKRATDRQQQTK